MRCLAAMRLAWWAAVPVDAGGFYMWDVSIAHQDWQDIAMSADGSKIYACSRDRTGRKGLRRSLDSVSLGVLIGITAVVLCPAVAPP